MAKVFDPYHEWLGIPSHEQPPHYYRLLAIEPFEANCEVIESAADRQTAHVRAFLSGQYGAQAQQLLNAVAAVKARLLTPEQKAEYDRKLRSKLEATKTSPAPTAPLAQIAQQKPPQRMAASAAVPPVQSKPPVIGTAAPGYQQQPARVMAKNSPTINVDASPSRRRRLSGMMPVIIGILVAAVPTVGFVIWLKRSRAPLSDADIQAAIRQIDNARERIAPTTDRRNSELPEHPIPPVEQPVIPPVQPPPPLVQPTTSQTVAQPTESANSTPAIPVKAPPQTAAVVAEPKPAANVKETNSPPPELHALDGLQISGLGLEGRTDAARPVLRAAYGGNDATDNAVSAGLRWLAQQQQRDGTWSLTGPYSPGAQKENVESATAMALLALLGNGNTHQQGPYQQNVADGLKAMLRFQDKKGNFVPKALHVDPFHTQAQCTMAICELYGMSKDPALRKPAENALKFCLDSQHELGGWGYAAKLDSDTSVTASMMMALQIAKMAGLPVSATKLDLISRFLDKASSKDGSQYANKPGKDATHNATAKGLLCRQYLGWNQDDKRLIAGADYLLTQLPDWSFRDMDQWYYATQTMHHMEGGWWREWNASLRDLLVARQVSNGAQSGSWEDTAGDAPDASAWSTRGGRLYLTCMSIYMLEAYYRHLPIYSKFVKKSREAE